MKKESPLSELDFNEIVIRWADELILNSNHLGELNEDSFKLDSLFSDGQASEETKEMWRHDKARIIRDYVVLQLKDVKEDVTKISRELEKYRTAIKNHLLSHRYINNPTSPNWEWILTDRGWLVKELGGHFKYQKHRKREINILKNQAKINFWLIAATTLAAIMPFVSNLVCSQSIRVTYPEQQKQPVDTVLLRNMISDEIRKRESTLKQEKSTKQLPPK